MTQQVESELVDVDFTLAIPVYNDGQYLRKTLESCINQAKIILLYDNCSTDDSGEICAEYAQKYAHVTHVRHAENLGAFENFRLCLVACETEYFMWLGAHDVLGENYVEPLLEKLRANKDAVLAVGKIFHINEDDSLRKKVTDLSKWSNKLQTEDDALLRLAAFMKDHFGSKKHDSLIMQGIFKADVLLKSRTAKPCIACDEAILCRAIMHGKFVYDNRAEYYARWFQKTRKKADEATRIFHGGKVPKVGGALSRGMMTLTIIDRIIEIGHQREDTRDVFRLINLVEKYALNPKRARKRRLHKKIAIGLIVIIGGALWFF